MLFFKGKLSDFEFLVSLNVVCVMAFIQNLFYSKGRIFSTHHTFFLFFQFSYQVATDKRDNRICLGRSNATLHQRKTSGFKKCYTQFLYCKTRGSKVHITNVY